MVGAGATAVPRHTLTSLLGRLRRQRPAAATTPVRPPAEPPGGNRSVCIDPVTHTFWRPGSPRSETLVEASPATAASRVGQRVAALVEARQPARAAPRGRGTANPGFTEALLVELLRAGRFERAFGLLAPECQLSWGSAEAFAAESAPAAALLEGVEIGEVRYLDEWTDEAGRRTHQQVAELEVEYALRTGHRRRQVRRTVHLVEVEGRWRTLLFPGAL